MKNMHAFGSNAGRRVLDFFYHLEGSRIISVTKNENLVTR